MYKTAALAEMLTMVFIYIKNFKDNKFSKFEHHSGFNRNIKTLKTQ